MRSGTRIKVRVASALVAVSAAAFGAAAASQPAAASPVQQAIKQASALLQARHDYYCAVAVGLMHTYQAQGVAGSADAAFWFGQAMAAGCAIY